MPSIEIVTHCYCPPNQRTYAEHLKWQFASILHHFPAAAHVTLSVCYTPTDQATSRRLDAMAKLLRAGQGPENLALKTVGLQEGYLFRRAIGRNMCALDSLADVVWFTDVDHCFGPGCLDAVAELVRPDDLLVMPKEVWLSYDHTIGDTVPGGSGEDKRHHAVGDRMVAENLSVEFPRIRQELFQRRAQKIAIGGVQIVGGNFAREKGYLEGTDHIKPVDASQGFRSCKCDRVFRKVNNLSADRRPIPNVYRIRHGQDGRDFNLVGDCVGKPAW